jgi:hypothetical protein
MINFTINSTDPDHYNIIKVKVPGYSNWTHGTLSVNSIVANCHIKVLTKEDYMTIEYETDSHTYTIFIDIWHDYTQVENATAIAVLINKIIVNTGFSVKVLKTGCLSFTGPYDFKIIDCTYNLQMILGLYYVDEFPVESDNKVLNVKAVGFYVSTPILYLVSTLGDINVHNYITDSRGVDSNSVCMRIQNSFSPMMPLISSNADFVKNINVGDLSNLELRLVDANLHDVHLLSPMWVTFNLQQQVVDKEKDQKDFWQSNFMKPPRQPIQPSELLPLNSDILNAFNEQPISGTI